MKIGDRMLSLICSVENYWALENDASFYTEFDEKRGSYLLLWLNEEDCQTYRDEQAEEYKIIHLDIRQVLNYFLLDLEKERKLLKIHLETGRIPIFSNPLDLRDQLIEYINIYKPRGFDFRAYRNIMEARKTGVKGRILDFKPRNYPDLFCCDSMNFMIYEGRFPLKYVECTRSYFFAEDARLQICQLIVWCPWCGAQLPKNLKNRYDEIIFEELGLEGYDDPRMPEEFKSDAWWKKRGL